MSAFHNLALYLLLNLEANQNIVMTEKQKIKKIEKIRELLKSFDRDTQKQIVWHHLNYLLSGDFKGVSWLLDKTGEVMDRETNILLSPFQ